jgi:hypothetical protein
VARLKMSPRNYALLGELNTRPRTTYLERIVNPPVDRPPVDPGGNQSGDGGLIDPLGDEDP